MTLFLLLSLSYASTIKSYDVDISSFETEKLCEDVKEESKKDSTADSLDILLTMNFILSVPLFVSLRTVEADHYKSVYDDPFYKPPRIS